MRAVAIILTCAALAGCQSTKGVPSNRCPPLVTYSPATLKAAAKELRALPQGSALEIMVQDYRRTRDAIRLCGK